MPTLVCQETGCRVVLGARCIIGRGPTVQLRIRRATVSAEHASVYFSGREWKVRDLGSRNGTFVNSSRLTDRESVPLAPGDRLAFGGLDEPHWVLDSIHPPGPTARTSRGELLVGDNSTLWLPSETAPEACVRFQDGHWWAETAEEARVVRDSERVVVGEETYQLDLPDTPGEDGSVAESTIDAAAGAGVELRFSVSSDQEHVALEAWVAGQLVPLGARVHNYTLLILAERRLLERKDGVPDDESGWIYAQDLRMSLGVDRVVLNLQLWRATQAFKKAGLPAEKLIERRLDSRQLRIGFPHLVVNGSA